MHSPYPSWATGADQMLYTRHKNVGKAKTIYFQQKVRFPPPEDKIPPEGYCFLWLCVMLALNAVCILGLPCFRQGSNTKYPGTVVSETQDSFYLPWRTQKILAPVARQLRSFFFCQNASALPQKELIWSCP